MLNLKLLCLYLLVRIVYILYLNYILALKLIWDTAKMKLSIHVKMYQKNAKHVSPANWALFINGSTHALKQLISLTTINTFSWHGGPEVMHPTGVREVPAWNPGSVADFYFWFCVLLLLWYSFSSKHIICQQSLEFLLQW